MPAHHFFIKNQEKKMSTQCSEKYYREGTVFNSNAYSILATDSISEKHFRMVCAKITRTLKYGLQFLLFLELGF